ncbi:MAG: 50S ribosomal protein L33, partial [bacterium]
MAKSQENLIRLKCSVCEKTNYFSTRNKKTIKDKLELSKFCNS